MVLSEVLEQDPAVRLFQYIKHAVMDKLKKVVEKKRVDPNVRLAVEVDARMPPALCVAVYPDFYAIPVSEMYEKPVTSRLRRQVLDYLIRKGARTDIADKRGLTPLHLAIMQNDFDLLCRLLEVTASVNALFDERGLTPLILAFDAPEWQRYAERLLKAGASVDECGVQGTALHYVVARGRREQVEFLLKAGARVNVPAGLDRTPLHIAVSNKALGIADMLLQRGADLNLLDSLRRSVLHLAALKGGASVVVRYLIEQKTRLDVRDREENMAIHYAAAIGDDKSVQLLLDAGVGVDEIGARSRTPLHFAVQRGSDAVVLVLLRAGASCRLLDVDGQSVLSAAVRRKFDNVVELLLQREPLLVDVADAPSGDTGLHVACTMHYESLIRMLVSRGANVNAANTAGKTPLHAMIESTGTLVPQLYSFLVERGAFANAIDSLGRTPLHAAVVRDDATLVSFMLARGSDVHAQDKKGKTPLHLCRSVGVARVLLQNGAAVEEKDFSGRRALHDVCAADLMEVAKFLVENGALVNIEDDNWQTPRTVAPAGPLQKFLSSLELSTPSGASSPGGAANSSAPMSPSGSDVLSPKGSVASAGSSRFPSTAALPSRVLQQPRMVPLVSQLLEEYKGLLNDQEFSDVTLLVENKPIYAHKAILVARCTYFRRMFSMERKGENRGQEYRIRVTSFRHVVFMAMLEFLYSCSVEVNDDIALELFLIAGKFGLDALRDIVFEHIRKMINLENAISLLLAAVQNKADTVRKMAVGYIALHYHSIANMQDLTADPEGASLLLEIMDEAQGRTRRAPSSGAGSGSAARPSSAASPAPAPSSPALNGARFPHSEPSLPQLEAAAVASASPRASFSADE